MSHIVNGSIAPGIQVLENTVTINLYLYSLYLVLYALFLVHSLFVKIN